MKLALVLLGASLAAGAERGEWIAVADHLAATPPESYDFNWGEGVQMCGVMQAYGRTHNERYADFVARWAAHHLPRGLDALLGNEPGSRGRKGYCGHWVGGTALVYLYEARKQPEYIDMARKIAGFIRAGATRGPEGQLAHWLGNYQIWVDTLYMACPLLSRLARLDNRPEYLEDAANQLLVSARHMEDERTGLFYHMWDWQFDKRSEAQWGRGNGWVIMSLADTLEFLPSSHRLYKPLRTLARRHARALVRAQDHDGLWHTVMNDWQSYPECSAATMSIYGLLKLVRLGAIPKSYIAPARRAWAAVNQRWVKDGVVTGVSAGTSPGNAEAYAKLPQGTQTWGTGSYLMAGAEIDRLR